MPPRVWILWVLFLARGSFYCTLLPLWEGWDEFAHFDFIEHWNREGTLPRSDDPISRDIDESMRLAPLSGELSWIGPDYLTEEQWWVQPAAAREDRMRRLASVPSAWARERATGKLLSYEAQQPPLYYWILAPPLKLAAAWTLKSRVLLMRLLSVAFGSCAIPLTWLAARWIVGETYAVFCAALLAVAPGFVIDTARVANDSLGIAAAALLVFLLIRPQTHWAVIGSALGACLLSKVYLVALMPVVIVTGFRQKRGLMGSLLLALGISGWWYARNLAMGHAFTGWQQRAETGLLLKGIVEINWFAAAQVIAKSFTWFGAWSFLTLKSWMYAVLEVIAAIGAVLALCSGKDLKIPYLVSSFYLAAMFYAELVEHAIHGTLGLPGWYMWPVAGSFAVILVAGLRRLSIIPVAALALLDLYGLTAVLTPYYAGLVPRNRADASQFFTALARLHVPPAAALVWISATIAVPLVVISGQNKKGRPNRSRDGPRY